MALSEFEKKRIDKLFTEFARQRVPERFAEQIRIDYRIKNDEVSLYESRPHYMLDSTWFSLPIARFKKDPETGDWQLYCADRTHNWRLYKLCPPSRDIEKLLTEVKNDPTGIFWG